MEDAPLPGAWWERVAPQITQKVDIVEILRVVMVLGLAMVAVLTILRPMVKSVLQVPALAAGASAPAVLAAPIKTVADLEGEIEAELDAQISANQESRRLPVLTKRVARKASQEPEHVARLIRSLLSEGER